MVIVCYLICSIMQFRVGMVFFGFSAFRLFGFLAFWLFGFLAFWLFSFSAFQGVART